MSSAIESMLRKYNVKTPYELENALKEIIQEITLAGLARAHFFDKAAFYGGTALRIFYGLPRFSEDLDFTLLSLPSEKSEFSLKRYFNVIKEMLQSFGLEVEIESVNKKQHSNIESAFLKANTNVHIIQVELGKVFTGKMQPNKKMAIKFEVDTTPPLGFATEIKALLPPITSAIRVLSMPDLFAGKMHAVLFRQWKSRIKGRDFYDLLWYLGQRIPLHLKYLQTKMEDGGKENIPNTREDLIELLEKRIRSIDFLAAKEDVVRFLKDPKETDGWSPELFLAAIKEIKITSLE